MLGRKAVLVLTFAASVCAQDVRQPQQPSVEIPYKGLSYSMLAKGGVTIMVAPLNRIILEYTTLQVWISNGSNRAVRISPQFFEARFDGKPNELTAGANDNLVVKDIHDRAKSKDMGELVDAYETTLFGFANEKSTSYYEQRKHAVLSGMGGGGKMRALATASAIILPERVLKPGEVIDGTVFFRVDQRTGRMTYVGAHVAGQTFDFPIATPVDQHSH